MYADIVRSLQIMIESSLSEINTQIPGTIVSYDAATNRAVVKPDLPRRLADDDSLPAPTIVEVPILWTASSGGKSTLTMPIKAGDGVMLVFQQRSLEGWLAGNKEMPSDPRQFDLSDCVAIPGCQSSGIVGDTDDIVLKYDKAQIRIKPDGSIFIGNDFGHLLLDNSGNLTLHVQSIIVEAPGVTFTLEDHKHLNTQFHASSQSGTPVPS